MRQGSEKSRTWCNMAECCCSPEHDLHEDHFEAGVVRVWWRDPEGLVQAAAGAHV